MLANLTCGEGGDKKLPPPISGTKRDISEIPPGQPIFSTMPESAVTMSTLPDIDRLRKFVKMVDCKQEVEIIFTGKI